MQDAEEIRKIIDYQKKLIESIESCLKQGSVGNKYKIAVDLELMKINLAYYETHLKKISS